MDWSAPPTNDFIDFLTSVTSAHCFTFMVSHIYPEEWPECRRYTRSTEWPLVLEVYTLYRVASSIGGIHALQSGL